MQMKVGDRVIVHFKNNLPDSTSIHWHGLRVPNDMDGVPGVTQDPVPAGGEFTYAGETDAPDFPEGADWINASGPISVADLQGKIVS